MTSADTAVRRLAAAVGGPAAQHLRAALDDHGLPTEIVRLRERGLIAASLGMAGMIAGAWGVHQLAGVRGWGVEGNLIASALVVLSLLVVLCVRAPRLSHQVLLNVGAAYAVVCSLAIQGLENIVAWPVDGFVRGVPWICIWIILLPVLVPTRPLRAAVVGLLCATTGPLSLFLAMGPERPAPSLLTIVSLNLPSFATVILATGTARLIYKLGTDVSRARQLGNYELVERIGTGGMGEVWRARHRLLSREAAVKLIRSDLRADRGKSTQTRLRRFEREASTTAMLRSPHTVQLYDFGAASDGTLYYVMELLDGIDLDTLVRRTGPLPLGRAVSFIRQVCSSLAEAHQAGLVHRDIKPANIFTCRLGTELDFVKVLDFGLVRPTPTGPVAWEKLTVEGWVAGSPAYMAPETVLKGGDVDHRVDIYGLGCVAYWLLTGRLVFDAETPLAIVQQHLRATPPPLSRRGAREVPAAVEKVIMQCLAKDPGERPGDATVIAESLAGYEQSWTAALARDWWQQNPLGARSPTAHDTVPMSVPPMMVADRPEVHHG